MHSEEGDMRTVIKPAVALRRSPRVASREQMGYREGDGRRTHMKLARVHEWPTPAAPMHMPGVRARGRDRVGDPQTLSTSEPQGVFGSDIHRTS